MTIVLNGIETLRKISIAWVGCKTLQTTEDEQTDVRTITYSERERDLNVSSRSLKIASLIADSLTGLTRATVYFLNCFSFLYIKLRNFVYMQQIYVDRVGQKIMKVSGVLNAKPGAWVWPLKVFKIPIFTEIFGILLPRCMKCRHSIAMKILSVCLCVRLSNAWIVTKRQKDLPYFYTIRNIIQPSFLRRRMVGGVTNSAWNFGSTGPR